MCSESLLPKEFAKMSEVLPFNKYGLSSIEEFKTAEDAIHHQEWLIQAGLTWDEIKLYKDHVAGVLDVHNKIESSVMKEKLDAIYKKIDNLATKTKSSADVNDQPSTSNDKPDDLISRLQKKPVTFYPEGHPMNDLNNIEKTLFGHLRKKEITPITKRRKILRRLERKKQRILAQEKKINISTISNMSKVERPGSLWDMKEMPSQQNMQESQSCSRKPMIGPKKPTMYTIKDNKVVRLEPVNQDHQDEYQAVDIVMPVNQAEEEMLEGTKMCIDDIRKIDRFKDYEPGTPSKVLYLKNIAPSVSQEQLTMLFNQFLMANGGPVDLRFMSGRMRGQAFVTFQHEDLAIQALEETNGTIMGGRPIIAEFGRNTNRIQNDNR